MSPWKATPGVKHAQISRISGEISAQRLETSSVYTHQEHLFDPESLFCSKETKGIFTESFLVKYEDQYLS